MFIINKFYLFLVIFYFLCSVFELRVRGDLHAILCRTYCGLELAVVLLVPLLVCFCQGAVSHTLWLSTCCISVWASTYGVLPASLPHSSHCATVYWDLLSFV